MKKPLLTYAVTTVPSPLQTGEPGQLAVIVSPPPDADAVINLAQLLIAVSVGSSAEDLSEDLGGVAPLAASVWDLKADGASGFKATPQSGASLPVGQDGFEFMLSNIPINNQPGTTQITISEKTVADDVPRHGSISLGVLKAKAPLTLDGPNADPIGFDYDGESTISWAATQGATITLNFNGKTYDHVKDQPDTPLPAVGSFLIHDITQKEVVVTVSASLDGPGGPEHKSQQVTLSMNAPEIVTLTTSRVAGQIDAVSASWTTKSAAQIDLTIGENPTEHVDKNGTKQKTTTMYDTQVNLSVTNPVGTVPKSVIQPPVTTNWTRLADGPAVPPDCLPLLFSTGSQIGMYAVSATAPIKVYLSDDAQSWRLDPKAPIDAPTYYPSAILSTPDTTYVPVISEQQDKNNYPSHKGNGFSLHRRDVATGDWTTSPTLDFTTAGGFYTLSLAADDTGKLYALGLRPEGAELYTSTDKGDSWNMVQDASAPLLAGYNFGMTTLQWLGGKLWLFGWVYGKSAEKPTASELHSVAYTPDSGWTSVPQESDVVQYINQQSVVVGGNLFFLPNFRGPFAGGAMFPLQLFQSTLVEPITGFEPSNAAIVTPMPSPFLFSAMGMAHFKGVFFASAGPKALPGGGIWMFNQPDF